MTAPPAPPRHISRPGLSGRTWAHWLEGDTLRWRAGAREGQVALGDIAAVRLRLSPPGLPQPSVCVIRTRAGRRHVISDLHRNGWRIARAERHAGSFAALVGPFLRRLAAVNPDAVIQQGPGRVEWWGAVIVGLAGLAVIAAGGWLMLSSGVVAWAALAFMGVVAVTLIPLWVVIRGGGPKPLDPRDLPF